jgi:4-carboxymuconolactone decarboxylase
MSDEQRSKTRPYTPRLPPLPAEEQDEQARELLEMASVPGNRTVNIFTTLVRHPGLFRKWMPFGGKLLRGKLPARDRELLILRTGWLCESEYEWAQHVPIGTAAGLSMAEVEAVAAGPDEPGWAPFDATLLRAVDQLHDDGVIDDPTWATLAERYDERQLIEVPMVVGHYHMVAFTLNSLGVPLEPDAVGFGAEA